MALGYANYWSWVFLACVALMCHETCEPYCEPFQLAYIRFRLAHMYIVLWLGKPYIMLLAVSFVLGIGFFGLLKFKAS